MKNLKINLLKISCVLFFILLSILSNAQNFSGLQGKELNKIDDASLALLSLGAKKLNGKIEIVTVTYDSEKTLKLDIIHSSLENNYISFSIIDATRKRISQISSVKYTQIGADKLIQVEFVLDENLAEGTTIESTYLQIDVKKSKSNFLPTSILYSLDKKWKTEINAENLIIPIKLEPIGSAKKLRANNRVLVIPYKKPILKYYSSAYVRDYRSTTSNTNSTPDRVKVIDHRSSSSNSRTPATRDRVIDHRSSSSNSRTPATRDRVIDHRKSTGNASTTPARGRGRPSHSDRNIGKTKEAQGPDNKNQISLWDNLATDIDFEFPYEITNIRMDIYPDKNLNSGVFYYLPNAYHLRWNTNEGYQFNMLYGTAKTSEISGDVRMEGMLTPSISIKESALIKSLLQSYVDNNKSIYTNKNIDLRIMPTKSTPTISLSAGLQSQYEISEDKINVTIPSTINNPIDVSWIVDNRVKEEIQVALSEGVGIQGTMVVVPDSETIPEQLIPVRITLADTRTIGKLILQPNNWRTKNWVNQTPFPLKLRYIHALVIGKVNGRNRPMIYSWDLNNTKVPSKSKVEFNSSSMPKWIESKTERIWIDYTIDECDSCVNNIMDKLTGGTSGSKTKTITFKSFQVLETTKAAFLEVQVRSIQADPKGKNVIKLASIIIEKDLSVISAGPFYLQESSELKYEYKLKLVMPNGKIHESDNWISSDEVDVYIGMHTLKETISNLPEF